MNMSRSIRVTIGVHEKGTKNYEIWSVFNGVDHYVITCWGGIGKKGSFNIQHFSSLDQVDEELGNKLREKQRRGYKFQPMNRLISGRDRLLDKVQVLDLLQGTRLGVFVPESNILRDALHSLFMDTESSSSETQQKKPISEVDLAAAYADNPDYGAWA